MLSPPTAPFGPELAFSGAGQRHPVFEIDGDRALNENQAKKIRNREFQIEFSLPASVKLPPASATSARSQRPVDLAEVDEAEVQRQFIAVRKLHGALVLRCRSVRLAVALLQADVVEPIAGYEPYRNG